MQVVTMGHRRSISISRTVARLADCVAMRLLARIDEDSVGSGPRDSQVAPISPMNTPAPKFRPS